MSKSSTLYAGLEVHKDSIATAETGREGDVRPEVAPEIWARR